MEISGADGQRVLSLVREAEEGASAAELQERALHGLMELIPADAAQCYRLSVDGGDGGGLRTLSYPQESFHEDPMVIYEHPLDHPLTEVMLQTPTSEAWRVSDVAGDRQWQRTHCYNLDFRPFGMRRHLVASAGSDLVTVEGYALVRSGQDFSDRDRDLLGFAQLQLAAAEHRLRQRERLLLLSAVALELVGSRGHGVAVVGEDGLPYPLNATAASLLPVVRDDRRLTGPDPFVVRQVEVRPHAPAAPGLPALLVLRDLAARRAAARLAGVTDQEHRTLLHLDGGRTPTETARRMGLSTATVRGYIASLHRKLEAGHTAALLRRGRDLGLLDD
ncbi:helix-turn-helix transcriptional regulator [Streptomyces yaanensis]|uniref:Helix-turn-helix transcriptional regulator n=1 Tax=Streptomyces yaanensis TaxID=1142239 RepID=A0ABV7SH79_9ACTN|nr:helix-turn-helix transcriptional regulator [Streptomyces sp. CGMCC 4.7035]WNB97424.1 helix-turn-helix transcriptional regulator [Streptomyces sp. CGMCC 4.7035]